MFQKIKSSKSSGQYGTICQTLKHNCELIGQKVEEVSFITLHFPEKSYTASKLCSCHKHTRKDRITFRPVMFWIYIFPQILRLVFTYLTRYLFSSHSHLQLFQRQLFCQMSRMVPTCLQPRALLGLISAFVFDSLFWSIPVIIKFKPEHVSPGLMPFKN